METEANKNALKKYESEKGEQVKFRVPKGKRALIQECANKNNESVNAMLNRLVDDEISKVLR